jgi:hypothetical protein
LELKESAAESHKAPEPTAGKAAQKKAAFVHGRAGTMAFDSHGSIGGSNSKAGVIESTPQGLSEAEPLGTAVERKLTAEANRSAKSHATEPMLKASSSK